MHPTAEWAGSRTNRPLAGISVDYLIRIEQGRDRNPSGQVLAALADALLLGEEDRQYLRIAALANGNGELCPRATALARVVRPTIRSLLDVASEQVANLQAAPCEVLAAFVDEFRIAYEAMQLPDTDDQRLIVCLPADERTAGALDRIAGRHPGAMRVPAAPA